MYNSDLVTKDAFLLAFFEYGALRVVESWFSYLVFGEEAFLARPNLGSKLGLEEGNCGGDDGGGNFDDSGFSLPLSISQLDCLPCLDPQMQGNSSTSNLEHISHPSPQLPQCHTNLSLPWNPGQPHPPSSPSDGSVSPDLAQLDFGPFEIALLHR